MTLDDISTTTTVEPRRPSAASQRLGRLSGLFLGAFLGTFAFNAANVALPDIQNTFQTSPAMLELIVASYGGSFAALLILFGRLGDRVGRRRLFAIGMSVFVIASLAAAFAPGIGWLIAARALQGCAAALATPQVLATIQATTAGVVRLRAVSIFAAAGGLGAAVGQVASGAAVSADLFGLGWRSIFLLCAVLAASCALLSLLVPATRSTAPAALDFVGVAGLAGGILAIVLPLSLGPTLGWPVWCLALLPIGPVLLFLLWKHQARLERRGITPLIPPSLFRLRPLRLGLSMAALFFGGYGGFLFVFAIAAESSLHVSPLVTGLALVPFAVVFAVFSVFLGPINRLLGSRTMFVGVSAQIVSLVGMVVIISLDWTPGTLIVLQAPLVLMGFAQALMFGPLVANVLREVPDDAAGLSGGLFSTVQQLALALGVVIIGAVFTVTRDGLGSGTSFALCIAIDAFAAIVFLVLALRLRVRRNADASVD